MIARQVLPLKIFRMLPRQVGDTFGIGCAGRWEAVESFGRLTGDQTGFTAGEFGIIRNISVAYTRSSSRGRSAEATYTLP